MSGQPDPLVEAIREYEEGRTWKVLREDVKPYFEEQCEENGADNINALDIKELVGFFDEVGEAFFGQPLGLFVNEFVFERFDFDGSGYLDHLEAFRCLKNCLQVYFTERGGKPPTELKFETPDEKGIKMIKVLASGGQGSAWLAESGKYGKVALKVYDKNNANAASVDDIIQEMNVMTKLQASQHIMNSYEIFQDQDHLYGINELLPGGDLSGIRDKCTAAGVVMDEDYWQGIFYQCLKGLECVHRHAIIHCDIKEPNIMIRNTDVANPECVIIDLGMAQAAAGLGFAGGTPGYRPPETNADNIWFPKGDVFSLGVTFFQLLADKVPDEKKQTAGIFTEGARSMEDVVMFVAQRPIPWDLISDTAPNCREWLEPMLEKQRQARTVPAEIMEEDFFSTSAAYDQTPLIPRMKGQVQNTCDKLNVMGQGCSIS